MSCCSGGGRYAEAERHFGPAIASRDVEQYRQHGPDVSSRLLLDAVSARLKNGDSVLDIGAGVGVLAFELLAQGVTTATLVDASPAYLDAARAEAERRHLTDRVQRVAGDFASLADSVAPADVVTMHRVVCCYPGYSSLLQAAATHARRVLALSYPRDRWSVRAWLGLENARRRISGDGFRAFVHPPSSMEAVLIQSGLTLIHRARTFVWSVEVYVRA